MCVLLGKSYAAPRYTVEDLGRGSAVTGTGLTIMDASDDGTVLGCYAESVQQLCVSVLVRTTQAELVGPPETFFAAEHLRDSIVVGSLYRMGKGGGAPTLATWTKETGVKDLGIVLAQTGTAFISSAPESVIVAVVAQGDRHGPARIEGGVVTFLLPEDTATLHGISRSGRVIAGQSQMQGLQHYLWMTNASTPLTLSQDMQQARIHAVNSFGRYVLVDRDPPTPHERSFLCRSAEVCTEIPKRSGDMSVVMRAVNDADTVVGHVTREDRTQRAVVWSVDDGVRDISTSTWTITTAIAITNNGDILAYGRQDQGGQEHALYLQRERE